MSELNAWIEKHKALWTRVYDEVIAPDMEEEWRKREEAHKEELRKNEETRLIMFKRMEEDIIKNSKLATENQRLKTQIEDADRGASSGSIPTPAPADESANKEDSPQLVDQFNELNKKYQDLEQQVKYLRRKNNTVMQKNKEMKESVRSWQEYCDRQAARQKPKNESKAPDAQLRLSAIPQIDDTRPHMPSSPRSVATVRAPLFQADHGRSSPMPMPPLDQLDEGDGNMRRPNDNQRSELESDSITPKPAGLSESRDRERLDFDDLPSGPSSSTLPNQHFARCTHSYMQAGNPGSSQTTVEELGGPSRRLTQLDMIHHDDDVPQFVSARSVNKRKRGEASKIEVYGDRSDGTPIKPFRVKDEPGSSPPNPYSLLRKDTVDLDAPASGLLKTPHHPRHQRSSSAPFSQRTIHYSKPDSPVDAGVLEAAEVDTRALSEPSDTINNVSGDVLKDLDPNIFAEPEENRSSKRVKPSGKHGQTAHRILAESGEEPPPTDENELRLPPSIARAKLSRKLHSSIGLRSHASTSRQEAVPASANIKVEPDLHCDRTATAKNRLRELPKKTRSNQKGSPTMLGRPRWEMKAPEPRPGVRKPPSSLLGKQDRLRSRPVEELEPADFKVNPAYNHGYSYAFSETVRKRGERACLPGCTNPQCCGSKFRAFAEAQAPLPASQEEALLEDYLGEAYDNMSLTQMASDERRELVLQARAKKMAKDAGKHREAYERRRTPPGFWRIDFPSTQEQEEDRRKAKELERELVRERWLETQRKGGKWIFRDE